MTKTLCALIMLCICGTTLYAQTETNLLILPSKSFVGFATLVRPPLSCQCLKVKPSPQKKRPVLSLDIPISPFWDTVREDRIKNRTIQFGGSATPWRDTVQFGGWPVPKIIFAVSGLRTTLEGGVMKTLDKNFSRTMKQARVVLEGSLWHALVGVEGFFGQEQIPLVIKGINFDADFRRRSSGVQGWMGVKFGSFNRSFVVGRYGRGQVRTDGSTHFNVPNIGELDWFFIYFEEFKTTSFSVEGKVKAKRISQSLRFDHVEYERVTPSPDPLRFGENHLEDLWLRTETEIIPFSRARFLRGVIILTKDFRDQNRLMFSNDYSSVRVLLRFSRN